MSEPESVGEDVLEALRAAVAASSGPLNRPVREHNRRMNKVPEECARLASTPAGREALTRAAESDPDPRMRLTSATAVETWNPAKAAETLVALVTAAGGTVTRPMTMTAALKVRFGVGRDAALCLFNLDGRGGQLAPALTMREREPPVVTVSSKDLDAAELVYSLAMNGGLDHAYEVAGSDFAAAATALDAVGATRAAGVIRDALRVVDAADGVADDQAAREAAVRALPLDAKEALATLGDRLSRMDDLMDRLESATER